MKAMLVLATEQLITDTAMKIAEWHEEYDIQGLFADGSGLAIVEWELNKRGLTAIRQRATYANNQAD